MLVVLGVVVLLIVVLLRWAASQMGLQTQTNQRLLKVVDRLSLEHKKGLWLIEAGDHYLLLATHEQGVTMLDRLESRAIKAQLPHDEAEPSGFWERLRRGKGAAPSQPQSASPELSHDASQPQSEGDDRRPTPANAQDTPATHASPAASAETETPTAIPTQFEVVSDGKSSSKETP